jgi:glycosyltransferase involved in cell wall biosynthesis
MARPDRLNVLTWHVHGNYLWYLSNADVTWVLPTLPDRPPGYGGRGSTFPFPDNVVEVPAADIADLPLDVVVHQHRSTWEDDRFRYLSDAQRRLPTVYLEHDPPLGSPTDTVHPVHSAADGAIVVHVTSFNRLMWDNGTAPTVVIEHGVPVPSSAGSLDLPRGVVVVNELRRRGRRLGADLVESVRQRVPLDVVGMGSTEVGGLGEVPPPELSSFLSRYRFMFHPARFTSLGLAVCEAMAAGVPVVGLATTELVTVIDDGRDGFIDTDVDRLVGDMRRLLVDRQLALHVGAAARATARARFDIRRFASQWTSLLERLVGAPVTAPGGRELSGNRARSPAGPHSQLRSPDREAASGHP